jgi:hypothetical protein
MSSTRRTIPDRLLSILRSIETNATACLPPTEIFNEGWMLRLTLDAIKTLNVTTSPLAFAPSARWYSEALLSTPFKPRQRADILGEGFTNADAAVGHFAFDAKTKAGVRLAPSAKQFVVVEAKMFSNLSAGTKNAPDYNQAARNVACMAGAIQQSGQALSDFVSLGFFVVAPLLSKRRPGYSNLETSVGYESIRAAVRQRVSSYETANRDEVAELRIWESDYFLPLLDHLFSKQRISVLSWDQCIADVREVDITMGDELMRFYESCLEFAPPVSQL